MNPTAIQEAIINDISAERTRQISIEGYTPELDDKQVAAELARAALCYITPPSLRFFHVSGEQLPKDWPLERLVDQDDPESKVGIPSARWKPMVGGYTHEGRIRELQKGASLVVAEIERLSRLKAREEAAAAAAAEAEPKPTGEAPEEKL